MNFSLYLKIINREIRAEIETAMSGSAGPETKNSGNKIKKNIRILLEIINLISLFSFFESKNKPSTKINIKNKYKK